MIIKKITIENFRSYYGEVTFDIGTGLNLIVGSNGDGKSTFYDALEWLCTTDGKTIQAVNHISKKKIAELNPGDSGDVKVSLQYSHDGHSRLLEKSFHFTKSLDGKIQLSNPSFILYKSSNAGNDFSHGMNFDKDFPVEVRQYSMFKGEEKLNVFRSADSLKVLLDVFSAVKGFDPYIKFAEDAVVKAANAADNARSKDKTNAKKAAEKRRIINSEETLIAQMENELREKEKTSANLQLALSDIESNKEASDLLIATNRRIDTLNSKKAGYYAGIKENYTTRLLDEQWILMGFAPIAKQFTDKILQLSKEKRRQEKEFNQKLGAKKLATQIELGFVPLAVNVPDKKTMEELLEDEVCKVCGRPAPKGSEPWLFMKHKLEDYLKSLIVEEDEEESKFVNQFIEELSKRDTTLNDNLAEQVTSLSKKIEDAIDKNEQLHDKIEMVDESLAEANEQKTKILASNDGLSEDDLTSAYHNINHMIEDKAKADRRIAVLKAELPKHKEVRDLAVEELRKISKDSVAACYENTCDIFTMIKDAFKTAKKQNKDNLLTQIEALANDYLRKLNPSDFKGRIVITEPSEDTAIAKLVDIDKTEVVNTNTAHKTTQYMSILFAISELAEKKDESEYPLLFDAPTSSFTEAKENEFFQIVSNLGKQVIIVTKSFLKDAKNGESVLDLHRVNEVNGNVYRIEKKRPFNDEDQSTIQTVVSKIK